MTVNQPLYAVFFHFGDDGLRIDVHNIQRFAAVGGFTAGAHSGGDTAADKQRQGKEQSLHPRIMDFGAKRLISGIIGTERIAVHNQHIAAIQVEHFFLRQ